MSNEWFKDYLARAVDVHIEDNRVYALAVLKVLCTGNGGAIFLLAAFIGILAQKSQQFSSFILPLSFFITALFCSAAIYVALYFYTSGAAHHFGNIYDKFLAGNLQKHEVQGYGLTKRGKIIILGLFVSSVICFLIGTAYTLYLLNCFVQR